MTHPVSRRVLALSEQGFLELAGKMSGVGYWRYDVIQSQVSWSHQVYVIHGVDPQSFDHNYENALDFYHPDDRPLVDRAMQEALRTGKGFEFQFRLLRTDGELRHVTSRAECDCAADGAVIAIFGVFQDITDHVTALKAAEIAREDAEEKARRAAVAETVAGLGHWRVDLPGLKLTWSEQMYAILGIPSSEPPDIEAFDRMLHPDDRATAYARLGRYFSGEPWVGRRNTRMVRPDGEIRWVVGDTRIERDLEGHPYALVGTVMDITEQKLVAQRIAESEARYRLITENSHDIVIKYSPEAIVRYVSPSIMTLLGYMPEEVIGHSTETMVYHLDRIACRTAFSAAIAGDEIERRDYRLLHKDGSIVWVDARPRALFDQKTGEIIGVTDVVRDVTARKQAEAALAASEERYRFLSDNATDMLAQFKGHKITFVSPGCRHTLGYESTELVGETLLALIHPDDKPGVLDYFADLVSQGAGAAGDPFQFRARRKDGAWVWLEGHPKIFFDDQGQPVMTQDVLRNITTRKTLEIELDRARLAAQAASQVKSEFLSNMSHELRTPLTSILGFSSLLKDDAGLSDEAARAVDRVSTSADALLAIVNDILDFSKLEAGQVAVAPQKVSVAAILQDAAASLELHAFNKGLQLDCNPDGSLPEQLLLDDTRLRQILVNLLSNAVKFTTSGGVSLRAVYLEDKALLRCEVEDTGEGIPADRLDRLFKRFSQVDGSATRAHGGAGLGLAICKGLVEAMGGEIGVCSNVGKGSVFWFDIPCRPGEPVEARQTSDRSHRPVHHQGLRILVAGDDAGAQEGVRLVLMPLGMQVTETSHCDEMQTLAQASPFDLILLTSRVLGHETMSMVQALRDGDGPNDLTPILAFAEALGGPQEWDGNLDAYIQTPVADHDLVSIVDHWTRPRPITAAPDHIAL